MSDMIFIDGMIVKRRDNAPDYVLCSLSCKVAELTKTLEKLQSDGWVNIDCMRSKGGKLYASLDQWRPTQGQSAKTGMKQAKAAIPSADEPKAEDDFEDDIPF